MLKNVVLPASFGPISDTTLPRGTTKSTPLHRDEAAELLAEARPTRTLSPSSQSGALVLQVVELLVVRARLVELARSAGRGERAFGRKSITATMITP